MTFVRNVPIAMATAAQVFPQDPGALTMVAVMAAMALALASYPGRCSAAWAPDRRRLGGPSPSWSPPRSTGRPAHHQAVHPVTQLAGS